MEKSVERCELSIVEGTQQQANERSDEDQDGLESKLIIRLHCKHGDSAHNTPYSVSTDRNLRRRENSQTTFAQPHLLFGPRCS